MLNPNIVSFEDLLDISGCETARQLNGWAQRNGIELIGGKRPATTIQAINKCLGVTQNMKPANDEQDIKIDIDI